MTLDKAPISPLVPRCPTLGCRGGLGNILEVREGDQLHFSVFVCLFEYSPEDVFVGL